MALIDDLRAVSENAVEQLAARFSELPRPLLAAIGAGDMAVARFADLRESLADLGDRVGPPSVDIPDVRATVADLPGKARKVVADLPSRAQRAAGDLPSRAQQAAGDLPSRAQEIAAEVATGIEHFAAEAPARVQELLAQLPDKLAEVQIAAQSLSPDQVRETVDAYAQLAGMIFGNLADRGDRTWTRVRSAGLRPEAAGAPAAGATTAAARASAAAAARASAATARAAAAAVRATTDEPTANAEPDSAEPLRVAAKSRPRKAPAATSPAGRPTPRNSPHRVTTPDGEAEVTVAPADVVPKGARVKPAARRTPPKSPARPAGKPAADASDEPIGS